MTSPRNKTLRLEQLAITERAPRLLRIDGPVELSVVDGRVICGDALAVIDQLPDHCIDLLCADPPYNLRKDFHGTTFQSRSLEEYEAWLEGWVARLPRVLTPTASIYLCGDWRSSAAIHPVLERHFIVRNRITWEREKGRGANANWKNCSEDIWFATVSGDYHFDADAVRLKRRVIAPYRDDDGQAKDWTEEGGARFRLTAPSNLWTDVTVPFWSMPENTDHPTQKPEKLIAKLVLASSRPGDRVLDPFLGSGTTAVVCQKLGRRWIGIEQDPTYCCVAERRLELAAHQREIQGYRDGVFWDRNAGAGRGVASPAEDSQADQGRHEDGGQRLLFGKPSSH